MDKAYIVIYDGVAWIPIPAQIIERREDGYYKIKYVCNHQTKKVTVPPEHIYFTVEVANNQAKNLNGEEEWIE